MIADLATNGLPDEDIVARKISLVSGVPEGLIEVKLSASRPLFDWDPWAAFLRYDVKFNLPGQPQITGEFGPHGHLRVYRGEPADFRVAVDRSDQRWDFAKHNTILTGFVRRLKPHLLVRYALFTLQALPCLAQMRGLGRIQRDY